MSFKDFHDLVRLAESQSFTVTSTTGGSHNKGSKHFLGLAIDVRTRDKSAKEITDFIKLAVNEGVIVRDERKRPPGQKVWGGPHLHLEIDSNRVSSFNNETVLKKNSKNAEAVKTLQNNLVKLGFLTAEDVDGDFGDHTEDAVEAFQKKFKIGIDGKVGDETKRAMNAALAALESNLPVTPAVVSENEAAAATPPIVKLSLDQLNLLAPNAKSNYRDSFAEADKVLAEYGINKNALRLAHFMAQTLHETGGLTIFIENMNYTAKRIHEVWTKRFPTVADALPFEHNPEKLANKVYGGRMGNGTTNGDGFRFIGRGIIQLTGRESYEKFGKILGVDLTVDPDLAFSAKWALRIACEEWKEKKCNDFADQDDLVKVTKAINGGTVGLDSRKQWLAKTKKVWIP